MEGIETKAQQKPRCCDYYSSMSFTDFLAWVANNDGSEPDISRVHAR